MSGKKKKVVIKKVVKKKKTAAAQDAKSVISAVSASTTSSKKSKKGGSKKGKSVAPSVISNESKESKESSNIGSGGAKSKTSLKSRQKSNLSSEFLPATPVTDRKLPPSEHILTIPVSILPNSQYQPFKMEDQTKIVIQKIIDAAPENSAITIPAGTYTENININKPISISAQGEVIILSPGNNHTIRVSSSNVTLKGLKIIQKFSELHSALYSNSGTLKILDCVIKAFNMPSLFITKDAVINAKNCKISGQKSTAIFMNESSQLLAEGCEIQDTQSSGIVLRGYSMLHFKRCKIYGHAKTGFICSENAKFVFNGGEISNCGEYGAEIDSSSNITMMHNVTFSSCNIGALCGALSTPGFSGCVFDGCLGPALVLTGGCGALLTQNSYMGCGMPAMLYCTQSATVESANESFGSAPNVTAVAVVNAAELTIGNAKISDVQNGIVANEAATLSVQAAVISKIFGVGLSTNGKTHIRVTGSSFSENQTAGIISQGGSSISLETVTVELCPVGIDVANAASFKLESCTLQSNDRTIALKQSNANIVASEISSNFGPGIIFSGVKGTVSKCNLEGNKSPALNITDNSSMTIDQTTIDAELSAAIVVTSGSTVTIKGCTLSGSDGVLCESGGVKASSSSFSGFKAAIQGTEGSSLELEGNSFSECTAGIIVADGASVSLAGDSFEKNFVHIEARSMSKITAKNAGFNGSRGSAAISAISGSTLSMSKCSVDKSANSAIYADSAASVDLTDVTLKTAKGPGVVIKSSQKVTISGGKVEGCPVGIYIESGHASISGVSLKKNSTANIVNACDSDLVLSKNKVDGEELFVK